MFLYKHDFLYGIRNQNENCLKFLGILITSAKINIYSLL